MRRTGLTLVVAVVLSGIAAVPASGAVPAAGSTAGAATASRTPTAAMAAAVEASTEDSGELLHVTEGNRLRRIDVDTIGSDDLVEDVLIEAAVRDENGDADPVGEGRDVNGMICRLPDGTGRIVMGEDTGQPSPPAGWGVFDPDGTQVGKLTATYFTDGAEPHGCAIGENGFLFTTEVGSQGFGPPNGQLVMWFPPYDRYPGDRFPPEPGTWPNDESSGNFCKLATDIGTAGGVAVDFEGRVYVASSSGGEILRFSPPFPTGPSAAGGCGGVDATGAPVADSVQREVFAGTGILQGMWTFSGLAMSGTGTLFAASVITGRIAEYDLDGGFRRLIVSPSALLTPPTGTPQGLTVGHDGTLYYADLNVQFRSLFPDLDIGPGPNGKVWRVRFDDSDNPGPPELIRDGLAFPDGVAILPGDLQRPEPPDPGGPGSPGGFDVAEWTTYAGSDARTFFNGHETLLNRDTAGRLREKWRFRTGRIVTGSPAVAGVEVPGEGVVQVVYFASWDGHVYAVRMSDGSELWRFAADLQPGASFPAVGSVDVSVVDGVQRVFIGMGETMHSLDAVTGREVWRFEAGTGCTDANGNPPGLCNFDGERNEIESSALVVDRDGDARVFFGMDVNDVETGKGGFYAVDAGDGRLEWFFDLETGETCRPGPGEEIRRYDAYHSERELGLPDGWRLSHSGCDVPPSHSGCGNVWSSAAWDERRGLMYFASSNCDTEAVDDPSTPRLTSPMPPYDEAVVALDFDGDPAWRWRPREIDNGDLAFGAVPNLFTIRREVDGEVREIDVVGVGNKDGAYYVLDRDGVNEESGSPALLADGVSDPAFPYWVAKAVPGGKFGGVISTAAVDERNRAVLLGTAPGVVPWEPQQPTMHAYDMDSGGVIWENDEEVLSDASYSPTSAVDGVVFTGSVLTATLRAYDSANGDLLYTRNFGDGPVSAIASGVVVVDGTVLFGTGVGSLSGDFPFSISEISARQPSSLVALCVSGAPDCPVITPGPPLRVEAIGAEGGGIEVRWEPPADDGGLPIRTYTVAGPDGRSMVLDGDASNAVFTDLGPGVHRFTVRATTDAGDGPPSDPTSPVDGNGEPVTCAGRLPTIIGTDATEILEGTDGDDVILALGGNDWVLSGAGDDVVCGGAGVDLLFGDEGADVLHAGGGSDWMFGGGGDDVLAGEAGNDLFFCGDGIDQADGGSGTDFTFGCESQSAVP